MTDDVIPRYLVLVGGSISQEYESESLALIGAESTLRESLVRRVEVVRSVRRWELDTATGEMLEVGEKLTQLT